MQKIRGTRSQRSVSLKGNPSAAETIDVQCISGYKKDQLLEASIFLHFIRKRVRMETSVYGRPYSRILTSY